MQSPYLATEAFQKRYEIVGEFLKDKIEKPVVADINCGQPLFKNFIDYSEYLANDIHEPEVDIEGITFEQKTDEEVDYKADVLCIFGYGGGDFTGHPRESKTTKDSIVRMARHKPRFIVLETCTKWRDQYGLVDWFDERLEDYREVFYKEVTMDKGEHYHDKRFIKIYELS